MTPEQHEELSRRDSEPRQTQPLVIAFGAGLWLAAAVFAVFAAGVPGAGATVTQWTVEWWVMAGLCAVLGALFLHGGWTGWMRIPEKRR